MTTSLTTPADNPLARWESRLPVLVGLGVAVGGLVLTAVGSGVGAVLGLGETPAVLVLAGFVALSAIVGWLWMRATRHPLTAYGFRRPTSLRRVGYALPLLLIPVIVVAGSGIHARPALLLAYAALTIAVGFNEEIWFRGLVLSALRPLGERRAILLGAALFGILHLANAAQGKSVVYLVLQLAFATLVGFVLGEVVAITRSLWIGIGWHVIYDLASFAGGDVLTARSLIALAATVVVLAGYGTYLWRRLPR